LVVKDWECGNPASFCWRCLTHLWIVCRKKEVHFPVPTLWSWGEMWGQ